MNQISSAMVRLGQPDLKDGDMITKFQQDLCWATCKSKHRIIPYHSIDLNPNKSQTPDPTSNTPDLDPAIRPSTQCFDAISASELARYYDSTVVVFELSTTTPPCANFAKISTDMMSYRREILSVVQ